MNGFLRRRLAEIKKTHPIVTQSMTMLVAHVERNLYAHLKWPFFRPHVFFFIFSNDQAANSSKIEEIATFFAIF